jgi:hypothetical protein
VKEGDPYAVALCKVVSEFVEKKIRLTTKVTNVLNRLNSENDHWKVLNVRILL